MIPFAVTIPAAERDQTLADKLRAEWGGMLAWALRGCLEWQRIGLAPRGAVADATAVYLAEEDTLAQWLREKCDVAKDRFALFATLYGRWCEWAKAMDGRDMAMRERTADLQRLLGPPDDAAAVQQDAQPVDQRRRQPSEVGQGPLEDASALAVALPQEDRRRRAIVRDHVDEHRRSRVMTTRRWQDRRMDTSCQANCSATRSSPSFLSM